MANPEHVEIVKQGAKAIAEWREANPDKTLDLSETKHGRANVRRADSGRANRGRANRGRANRGGATRRGVDLCRADLSGADLSGADLSGAILRGADLCDASLRGANLRGADLFGTNLTRAELHGTNLSGVYLGNTNLSFTDLSETLILEGVHHFAPSDIGIQAIIESKGKIPEIFLRGCGVPEEWITHIPDLLSAMQPSQFYSCFISYSHADKEFARRLHDALQGRGIRCWLDEHQLLAGDDPHEQIDRGISLWDKVLLCASKESLTSWWVDNEIATTFEKERRLMKNRGKKVLALVPLDLDGYLGSKECPNAKKTQLRTRIAADFIGWDKDNALFEREFEKLIKALQTNDTGREKPPESLL